jgi:RNA polymerase-binding transcription factor DksA
MHLREVRSESWGVERLHAFEVTSVLRPRLIPVKAGAARRAILRGMKPWQKDQLHRALEQRHEVLLAEINRDTERLREEHVATDEADLTRDVDELRDVEAARRRMDDGTYGICTDCGVDIGFERLHAEPEAARCIDCQRRHEKTYRR